VRSYDVFRTNGSLQSVKPLLPANSLDLERLLVLPRPFMDEDGLSMT
jgi:hypothetical protein